MKDNYETFLLRDERAYAFPAMCSRDGRNASYERRTASQLNDCGAVQEYIRMERFDSPMSQ